MAARPERAAWRAAAGVCAVLVVLLAGPRAASADIYDTDATPSWEYLIDGPAHGDDVGLDLAVAGDTVYACGYASTGDRRRRRQSRPPRLRERGIARLHSRRSVSRHVDTASDIALDPRGGALYTAGITTRTGLLPDLLVVRWRRSGAIVWARSYRGPAGGSDSATDVGVDRRGNVTACGPSTGSHGTDWAVVSWSPSGSRSLGLALLGQRSPRRRAEGAVRRSRRQHLRHRLGLADRRRPGRGDGQVEPARPPAVDAHLQRPRAARRRVRGDRPPSGRRRLRRRLGRADRQRARRAGRPLHGQRLASRQRDQHNARRAERRGPRRHRRRRRRRGRRRRHARGRRRPHAAPP